MISKEFFNSIEAVIQEKDLSREQVLDAFRHGLIAGCKKTHGVRTCRVELKEEKNEILLYKQYFVYSEDLNSIEQSNKDYTLINLVEAKEMNARAKVGEILEIKVDPKDFSLNGAKEFKNKFNEQLNNYQKENVYTYYKSLQNEMIGARIIDADENFYRLEIGKDLTTLLPKKDILPTDSFHLGERTKVYVTDVEMKTKWPKIYVSRIHPNLIIRLLEDLVPEIKDGTIEIVGISRDAGDRAKIGIRSNDPKVDPIGATVGEGGSRIREIVKALSGEKIDLFRWSDNEQELIANALQPAKVIAVTKVNPKEKSALAIVPADQLSLAIGKLGQNVKLAVQATGWSIDIKSDATAADEGIIF